MSLPVRYRVAADNDIDRRVRRYARKDVTRSYRFLQAIAETEHDIAKPPGLGSPWPTTRKQFANLRYCRVRGFEEILVFYREMNDDIIVSRVLHARQNISRIFPAND